ncbi:hypothetical protein QAD02_009589 [Eretmocerus hayati]|uniref:Uncharacterized protein n=1 Tax=Eretmocerus hayati TaxID=131215 RepID=A0ACC2NA35_9HYME|nr:hypothetical protein QAD02_009589 [Eretmocerus hayati]
MNLQVFKLVKKYFEKDYSYEAIRHKLKVKLNVEMSCRTLERVLAENDLKRKNIDESDLRLIIIAILLELHGPSFNLGYKAMWKRIRKVYNLNVKQNTVMIVLQELDPVGVERRRRYQMKNREYEVPGPNFIWHSDGHDKLKQFGFPIYGIIDGYSRKLLVLEVATTNNNPRVIGHYYLRKVQKLGYIPVLMRVDNGTECGIMEDLHVTFRLFDQDNNAGVRSFLKGKSTANQRIECWWRQLRQKMGDFYIHLFKQMERERILDSNNPLHIDLLRFCFGSLVRKDLELTRKEWNEHTIRKQNNRNVTSGKPNEMYDYPQKFGARDYKIPLLISDKIPVLLDKYTDEPRLWSENFDRLLEEMPNIQIPTDPESAFVLFVELVDLSSG